MRQDVRLEGFEMRFAFVVMIGFVLVEKDMVSVKPELEVSPGLSSIFDFD